VILGCLRTGCGKQPGSWRAFSFPFQAESPASPLREEETPASNADQEAVGTPASQAEAPDAEWGGEDGNWGEECGPTQPSNYASSSAADPGAKESLDDLVEQLGSALKLGGTEPRRKQKDGLDQKGQETVNPTATARPSDVENPLFHHVELGSAVLPEFYLCQEAEPGGLNSVADVQQRHIAELLKKYNQENHQQVMSLCHIIQMINGFVTD
jgi:hypothetical protein